MLEVFDSVREALVPELIKFILKNYIKIFMISVSYIDQTAVVDVENTSDTNLNTPQQEPQKMFRHISLHDQG